MKLSKVLLLWIILICLFLWEIFLVYPKMPEMMASHWNLSGQVDGYLPKFWGITLMPFLTLAFFLLFVVIPKIDPLKENINKFKKHYNRFVQAFFIFFFYVYFLTLVWNLGLKFNFIRFLSPAFSFLIYFTAKLIEKAQPNWFIGIRTPWTLSNKTVWEKTHQMGTKLFMVSAAISFLGTLFPQYAFYFILCPIVFSSIFSFIYSYFEFQKEKRD